MYSNNKALKSLTKYFTYASPRTAVACFPFFPQAVNVLFSNANLTYNSFNSFLRFRSN